MKKIVIITIFLVTIIVSTCPLFSKNSLYWLGRSPSEATLSDVNNDNFVDMIISNNKTFEIMVFINKGDGTFTQPNLPYPCGIDPMKLEAVDINNDGYVDIIICNFTGGTIGVYINKGDGTFESSMNYDVGIYPNFSVADVDNDGWIDLIKTNMVGANIYVMKNNQDGTFSTGVSYKTCGFPNYIYPVDLNKDSYCDLVVAGTGPNGISVLINKGNGTFNNELRYKPSLKVKSLLSIIDLDNDQFPDIVSVCETYISIFMNNGNGTFSDERKFSEDVTDVRFLTIGDIDNDGYNDILLCYRKLNKFSISRNIGNASFSDEVFYETGDSPGLIEISDVNNDSYIDLFVNVAIGKFGEFSVFLNKGDGSFELQNSYYKGISKNLSVSDVDNDGYGDAIVVDAGDSPDNYGFVSVLMNNGEGTFDDTQLIMLIDFSGDHRTYSHKIGDK